MCKKSAPLLQTIFCTSATSNVLQSASTVSGCMHRFEKVFLYFSYGVFPHKSRGCVLGLKHIPDASYRESVG